MKLDVTLRGGREVQQLFKEIGDNAVDLYPAFRHISEVLVHEHARRFRLTRSFEPLEASTVKRKIRAGAAEPTKPMVRSGDLRDSLTRLRAPNQTLVVRRDHLRFGTRLHYATFHGDRAPVLLTAGGKGKANRTIKNWIVHDRATDKKIT